MATYQENEFMMTMDIDNEQDYISIKGWDVEDRPREKMMAHGAQALTKAELLAIIIGSGTTKKSAVELMSEILRDCDGRLSCLSQMSMEALTSYDGIGPAKALSIMAAAEIGRRRAAESAADLVQIGSGADVMKYMRAKVQDLTHEESWALLLNNNAKIIRCVHISSGGITETSVDIRMLLKEALLSNATSFILIHNHPSGKLLPSNSDRELTTRVAKAAKVVNIRMLDHVIVTDSADMNNYFSFAEEGYL